MADIQISDLGIGTPAADASFPFDTSTRATLRATLSIMSSAIVTKPGLNGTQYRSAIRVSASKIKENAGSITPSVYKTISWTYNNEYKIEFFAKAVERSLINVFCNNGVVIDATFDVAFGVFPSSGASLDYVGGGWYRCTVTAVASSTASANLQFRVLNNGATTYTGVANHGMFVEQVSVTDLSAEIEIRSADDLSSDDWTKVGVTVSSVETENLGDGNTLKSIAATVAGVMSADYAVEASGASVSPSVYRFSETLVNGSTYVFTVDAKAGERKRLNLYNNGGASFDCTFNLELGTCTGTGASITALGEGWYRCQATKVASGTTGANMQIRIYPNAGGHPYAGDGTSGLYLNAASLKKDDVEVWTNTNLFSGSSWSRQDVSVTADAAIYRTLFQTGGATTNVGLEYYSGKKWAALGTSITAQNQYVPVVSQVLDLTAENLGVSGGSLASGSHYGSLDIYDAIAGIDSDSDLVTLEAGTNDFGTDNSDLGTLGDTTTATFYGALYAAVVAIQAQAPDADIVFLTPYSGDSRDSTHRHFRTNTKGHTLRQFQVAVMEVAALLGLPCIDVGQEAGLGYLTLTDYSSDGLHLNAAGGRKYGAYVAAKLIEIAEAK